MKDILYDYEVEEAVNENNITYWFPFKCSICGESYGFYFSYGRVVFNGSCGCSSAFGERLTDYQEIADIYNNNKSDKKFRKELLSYFNISDIIE